MTIDIFSIEPTKVSRDLRGKVVILYGEPKVGKTTNATKFPKPLLVAFEKGYSALSGVKAVPIQKWSDFKKVLKQLADPRAHDIYETVVLDTLDIAYSLAEKYICQREGVDDISTIPYGKGYSLVKKEFEEALRSIPLMDYGLVMISHAEPKTFTDEEGQEYTKITPTLPKRPRQIALGMADIIGYAKNIEKDGETKSILFLRGTPRFEAGSRFKYTPPYIPFTYDALVNAIADAIEKEGNETGQITDEHINLYKDTEQYTFDEIKQQATEIIQQLMSKDEKNASKITKIIEEHLGKGRKLAEATDEQMEMVVLIVDDLKDLLNE
jgi:hypothetical protein